MQDTSARLTKLILQKYSDLRISQVLRHNASNLLINRVLKKSRSHDGGGGDAFIFFKCPGTAWGKPFSFGRKKTTYKNILPLTVVKLHLIKRIFIVTKNLDR